MPRKSALDPIEKGICDRLRQFRVMTGLSLVAFARLVSMDSSLLRSYESGYSQLNYRAARRILMRFPILNPEWLATGRDQPAGGLKVSLPDENQFGPRTPFSLVYDLHIHRALLGARSGFLMEPGKFPTGLKFDPNANGRVCAISGLGFILQQCLEYLPDEAMDNFVGSVVNCCNDICKSYPDQDLGFVRKRAAQMAALLIQNTVMLKSFENWPVKEAEKKCIKVIDTGKGMTEYSAPMKPYNPLQELLERVRKATKTPGAKSQLARDLGVTRQAVNRWIHDNNKPSAETALHLLAWVKALEKNRTLGDGTNTAKGKTQKGESNETHKSGHKKT